VRSTGRGAPLGGGARRRLGIAAVLVSAFIWPAAAFASTGPALLGSAANSTSLSGAISVAVSGQYAYTTAYWPGQLTVLDISNPITPTVVGTTLATSSLKNGSNITISGSDAFVVSKNRNASSSSNDDGSGNGLTVVDISNPTSPLVLGTLQDPTRLFGAYGVAVQGQDAYVASQGVLAGQPASPDTSEGSFSVIDLATMTIVAHIDNGSLPAPWTNQNVFRHATSVAISGHYAYVTAFYDDRVTVVDISNPSSPVIVASLRDATNLADPADLAVQGNYLYLANQVNFSNQFSVVDISNPAKPVVVGSLNDANLEGAYRVRVRGDFAYVSASNVSTIAAVDISNPASPRVAGFVNDPAHLSTTTGLDLDGSGRYVVASSARLSTELGTNYPLYPGQSGGPTDTGTISVIDMDPSPISVALRSASEPSNPTTQTSATFSFSANDSVSAVQCRLDGGSFAACSSPSTQSYSLLGPGQHTFTVQATDGAGNTSIASYTWTVGSAPVNSAPPAVSGVPTAGQTLTASPGTWSAVPTPTYGYQWLQCAPNGQGCTAIASANAASYVVAQADVGHTLAVAVTAGNGLGSPAPAQSQPTAVVSSASSPPQNTAAPTVSGTAMQGQTLTAVQGAWSGSPAPAVVDQWQRCDQSGQKCSAISGGNQSSYVVQAADEGSTLVVFETATNAVGTASVSSAPTAVVPATTSAPQNTAAPSLSAGTVKQGAQLTVSNGTWLGVPAPTYSYQWQRCDQSGQNCGAISGATGASYTTQRADVGDTLRAIVTATNSAGSSSSGSAAAATVIGPPVVQSLPEISGTPRPRSLLTGSAGIWTGYPAPSYTYRWERCNSHGAGCSARPGQTTSGYTVVAGDVGSTLRLVSSAANSSGSASAISGATAVVSAGLVHAETGTWQAVLIGAPTRRPSLRLTIPAGSDQALAKKLTISPPTGLSFLHSKRLAKAITVRQTHGQRLTFTAVLVHRDLELTLKRPTAGIEVVISSLAVVVSKQLTTAAKRRRLTPPEVAVTVAEAPNGITRGRLKLRFG
jgi:hypothetical protein